MLENIQAAINTGLWPESKTITSEPGDLRLEKHGWKLFYNGKNADLYFIPGIVPRMCMIRTDRTSVFDIPLDLIIEGKGEIQNQLSLFGAKFAQDYGINVIVSDEFPEWFPVDLLRRSQIVEMCKPLSLHGYCNLELIFRNKLTGSLKEALDKGEDPYWLFLPPDLKEMHSFSPAIFTPTTKGVKDKPIPSLIVQAAFPTIYNELLGLFIEFSRYAYERGFVVVDTKLEAFIGADGKYGLGDEILTPESSRFIPRALFEQGIYTSADKQLIRDFGEEQGWKKQAESLLPGEILHVEVPEWKKQEVVDGYQSILDNLAA